MRLFRDNSSPVRISVHLLDIKSDEETAAVGDAIAENRRNCEFYGWAEWTVADASQDGRKVCNLPEWWHAAIVLPCEEDDKQGRERHAELLAASAVCRPRPHKGAGGRG